MNVRIKNEPDIKLEQIKTACKEWVKTGSTLSEISVKAQNLLNAHNTTSRAMAILEEIVEKPKLAFICCSPEEISEGMVNNSINPDFKFYFNFHNGDRNKEIEKIGPSDLFKSLIMGENSNRKINTLFANLKD